MTSSIALPPEVEKILHQALDQPKTRVMILFGFLSFSLYPDNHIRKELLKMYKQKTLPKYVYWGPDDFKIWIDEIITDMCVNSWAAFAIAAFSLVMATMVGITP